MNITLKNYNNDEFLGLIGIGSPVQLFNVVFDTGRFDFHVRNSSSLKVYALNWNSDCTCKEGSSDIWIPSIKCSNCGSHSSFNPSLSSTYSTNGPQSSSFDISYGSGGVSGNTAAEDITFYGSSTKILKNIFFGQVTKENDAIRSFHMDGVCGLAFSGLSTITKPSLIEIIFEQYPNVSRTFSLYLNSDPADITSPSRLYFGSFDLSLVGPNAKFYYTPVIK